MILRIIGEAAENYFSRSFRYVENIKLLLCLRKGQTVDPLEIEKFLHKESNAKDSTRFLNLTSSTFPIHKLWNIWTGKTTYFYVTIYIHNGTLGDYFNNCEWKESAVAASLFKLLQHNITIYSLLFPKIVCQPQKDLTLGEIQAQDPSITLQEGFRLCARWNKKISMKDFSTLYALIGLSHDNKLTYIS